MKSKISDEWVEEIHVTK